jgi:hypothetical protein
MALCVNLSLCRFVLAFCNPIRTFDLLETGTAQNLLREEVLMAAELTLSPVKCRSRLCESFVRSGQSHFSNSGDSYSGLLFIGFGLPQRRNQLAAL